MNSGEPDRRGPGRYLCWLAARQPGRIALSSLFGTVWMLGVTVPPYLLSRAIDDGLQAGDFSVLLQWTAALFGVGLVTAVTSMLRHRTMTKVRMDATFRTVQLVMRQVTRVGAAISRHLTAGEVVTVGMGDVRAISWSLTVAGPGVGSIISYIVVAFLLFQISTALAVVILLGVPLLAVTAGPLLHRLQRRQAGYRELQSGLAARFTDIAGGLRVLNGIGGKAAYAARYRDQSQVLRREGYRVGAVASWIQALSAGLPALFLAAVTWLAARMAAQDSITVGQLVSVYGYAAVLTMPVADLIEDGYMVVNGLVAARRVLRILDLGPDLTDRQKPAHLPVTPAEIRDEISGVVLAPGSFTGLVSARPADSEAVIDRLGRFIDAPVFWGSVPLSALPLQQVREHIVVADNEAAIFAGSARDVVSGRSRPAEDALQKAIADAAAQDVIDGLPDGLDSGIESNGRNLSGGQRQRIRLARAFAADPDVLLAMDPTSAVDVHTEATMAAGIRAARNGKTTLIAATSPILLDQTDVVYFLVDGTVVASGPHRDLLHHRTDYRALLSRGEPA